MASRDKLPILRGTLDVLILRSIASKPLHGFEISLWLEQGSDGTLDLDDSALYQALHRLEARRLIQGEWGTTENNRRARYYRLTPAGRSHLDDESRRLVSFARTLTSLLSPSRGK
ncbi:MAG TPA: PadR family transcriptional regulator [Vicinamibacterales bacterium]|nr:PadR family transcriptional regulator [Vicinamibacterales bacterium]